MEDESNSVSNGEVAAVEWYLNETDIDIIIAWLTLFISNISLHMKEPIRDSKLS